MKVKIHKGKARRIICEELDRLGLVYEKISRSSGYRNRMWTGRGYRTRLGDYSRGDCSDRREKRGNSITDLDQSIQDEVRDVIKGISELTRPNGAFSDFKQSIEFIMYVPYKLAGVDDILGENTQDRIDQMAARASANMRDSGMEGIDYSDFDLINAVDAAGCPGSFSCHVSISRSVKNMSRVIAFYQEVNKLVNKEKNSAIKMRQAIDVNASPDEILGSMESVGSVIEYIDAASPPAQSDLVSMWFAAISGEPMCTLDDSGNIVDALMGDGESGSASQMFPCSDLARAAEQEQSDREAEIAAAAASATVPQSQEDPITLGHKILSYVQNWWREVDTDATFGQFKGTVYDDVEDAADYYEKNYWPQDLVDQLDSTQRRRIMKVLEMIKEQMTDTIINDVAVEYEGVKYFISDDKLDI